MAVNFGIWTAVYFWLDGVMDSEGLLWFAKKENTSATMQDSADGSFVSTDSVLVERVSKKYGSVTAIDNVTLSFRENEIFVFTGLNGCGKTSMLNLISGLSKQSSGNVVFTGPKKTFGIMPEINTLPD